MRKRLRPVLGGVLALLCALSVLPPGTAAASPPGRVVFESSAPDEEGYFDVTMTVSDVTFRTIEFALRYDPEVIQPVDASGKPAAYFGQFAQLAAESQWLSSVGLKLVPETGFIDFTVFVNPGTENELIQVSEAYGTQAVVEEKGLELYVFHFKRLQDGDIGLQVATKEKGEPFNNICPGGFLVGGNEGSQPVTVIFREAEKPESSKTETLEPVPVDDTLSKPAPTVEPDEPPQSERSPEELLKQAVVLKIGSHAAVVNAGVTAIYPGERAVTAYAHDDRTFVPVRFVSERLGADVDWDNDTQTVTVKKEGHTVEMTVGSLTYTLDGEEKALDVPAEFTPSTDGNSRTMVPVRFVSEALGYQVEWDQARALVIISPPSLSWEREGRAEAQAMEEAVRLLTMYSGFV